MKNYLITGVSRARLSNDYVRKQCERHNMEYVALLEDKDDDRYYLYFITVNANRLNNNKVIEAFGNHFNISRANDRHKIN